MAQELVLSTTWHDEGRRKLESVRACQDGDLETLVDLLNTYLSYRGRKGVHTSDSTRSYYEIALRDWFSYCWPQDEGSTRVPLLRASRDDVEHYLAILQTRGGHLEGSQDKALEPGSVAAYLSGLRAFYKALLWAGALKDSPVREVSGPSDPRPRHERRPALPLEDYRRILELCSGDDPASLRLTLIVRLMGDQGLRISEVVNLKLADIDLQGRTVYVAAGKGGKTRTIPLSAASHEALSAWLNERAVHAAVEEQAVLVNTGKKVKKSRQGRAMHANTIRLHLEKLYQKAGLSARYRGAHMLRHTAGTRLYRNTRDLHRVAQILGHSDVNTSSIYAKMDLEGLKDAMATLDDES